MCEIKKDVKSGQSTKEIRNFQRRNEAFLARWEAKKRGDEAKSAFF